VHDAPRRRNQTGIWIQRLLAVQAWSAVRTRMTRMSANPTGAWRLESRRPKKDLKEAVIDIRDLLEYKARDEVPLESSLTPRGWIRARFARFASQSPGLLGPRQL